MEESTSNENQWYVAATAPRTDEPSRVLKAEDTFGIFDRHGDIYQPSSSEQGLYHGGTRFLSHLELRINGERPLLLNSTIKKDNSLLTVDMTMPDLYEDEVLVIPMGSVHVFRSVVLASQTRHEHLRLVNYGDRTVVLNVEFRFAADYRDIFEVRGVHRPARGTLLTPDLKEDAAVLGYRGLDGEMRQTNIQFHWRPDQLNAASCSTALRLGIRDECHLHVSVSCSSNGVYVAPGNYYQAIDRIGASIVASRANVAHIVTSNEQFNDWINRSAADLDMLVTETPHGPYPYAGVPWFSTPFGRDGIITAMQTLWIRPQLAKGVITYLAATQAEALEPERDAEPGKILHEARSGEMAALGEIPFKRYYGTVDATPLFVLLAGHYYRRTGDRAFVEEIWPHIERALNWIDHHGDWDGDGFVEYARHSANGLIQQGWKDSNDSVFHADGNLAAAPIALCEVQGYVYEAKLLAAELAELLGWDKRGQALRQQAAELKKRFNEAFWLDELDTFALALDGDKRPCAVRTSNAGHALFTGIADPEYARRAAETLIATDSFNGWGIRTVAAGQCRYNPMSYHNGSVWPHDTAIAAMGLARYGFKDKALKILTGLFDAAVFLDLHRLPELFCGFSRLPGQGPTLYPVACSPQAWASGAVFQLLQGCLGLSFSPETPQIRFYHPRLPNYLNWLRISNLRFDAGVIDLALTRHAHDVGINVERKEGDIEVTVVV
jgi:glycogen debranching enzyme